MRDRSAEDDDPTIVRHLHDLAALETLTAAASTFRTILLAAATADTGRGGGRAPADPGDRFALMIERLSTDRMWADEYKEFVHNVSFARPDEEISFTAGLDATRRLVEIYKRRGN